MMITSQLFLISTINYNAFDNPTSIILNLLNSNAP